MKNKLLLSAVLSIGFSATSHALTLEEYVPSNNGLSMSIHKLVDKATRDNTDSLPNKKILIIDTSKVEAHDYDAKTLKTYDSLLLVGGAVSVQKAMKILFGFTVDGDALLIDNVNDSLNMSIKRYAPNFDISDDKKAAGLLRML